MPRKLRIQYPGALYHVISHGNNQKELFLKENMGEIFENALLETAVHCGWKLHAYVIMGNHYHLVIETPKPNLVDGMRWLQSTFASSFNRVRNKRGNVFQGRYKAIVVSENFPLLGLVDYVHLNPVRAGKCALKDLRDYALSSYPKYFKRTPAEGLWRDDFFGVLDLPSSLAGMNRYAEYLKSSDARKPKLKKELKKQYCWGWFLGSKEERDALSEDIENKHPSILDGSDRQEVHEAQWESLARKELRRLKKRKPDIVADAKGADWKIEIARVLRKETNVKNSWIADRLNMGHASRVSNLIQNKS